MLAEFPTPYGSRLEWAQEKLPLDLKRRGKQLHALQAGRAHWALWQCTHHVTDLLAHLAGVA